jgi:hypothetical protein
MLGDRPLMFVDPEDREIYEVRPWREMVEAAYTLGLLPYRPEDKKYADELRGLNDA